MAELPPLKDEDTLSGAGIPLLHRWRIALSCATGDREFQEFSLSQDLFLSEAVIDRHETRMLDFRAQLDAFTQLLKE